MTSADNVGNTSTGSTLTMVNDTTAPTAGVLSVNGTLATSGSGSTSSTTNPAFTIGARTDYTETQSGTQSGLASSTLTVQSETLINGTCDAAGSGGPFTTAQTISGTTQPGGILSGYCDLCTLTGTDNVGNTSSVSTTVHVPLSTDLGNNVSSPCTLGSNAHSCTVNGVTTASSRNELVLVFLNNGSSGTRTIGSIGGTAEPPCSRTTTSIPVHTPGFTPGEQLEPGRAPAL